MEYFGNYLDRFDIDELLSYVKNSVGERCTMTHTADIDQWISAGGDTADIEWYNYYSGKHFPEFFSKEFGKLCNIIPIKVWITEIQPAKSFPYCQDISMPTVHNDKTMIRLHCHLLDCTPGHFFLVSNYYQSDYKKGDIYKWNDYKDKHASGNFGLTTKYQFNYLGIKDD